MARCQSVVANGEQCKQPALPSRRYCWQHDSRWVKGTSLGAIIAVLSIFLVWIGHLANVITIGQWIGLSKAPVTQIQPTPSLEFIYQIRVLDAAEVQPRAYVRVTIELQGKAPLDETTDSNGYARIFIPSDYVARPGRLLINEVSGRELFRQEIDLYPDRLPDTISLDPHP